MLPWDSPVWCDPGGVDEWVDRSQRRHPRRDADHAELHAREHYDRVVQVRAARIELFSEMCRRQGLPVPHTLDELLTCLVGFGLFDIDSTDDGEWVTPRLDQDPTDILPLVGPEILRERQAQQDDRTVLVAITVREIARRSRPRWRRRAFTTDVDVVARTLRMPATEVRRAFHQLGEIAGLRAEPVSTPPRGRVRVTVPWPEFARRFPFVDLPAPEHAV
jgi:hypothetical protein